MVEEWNPNAPEMGQHFTDVAPNQPQYNIYFRAIDFDMHEDRIFGAEHDREVDQFWHDQIGNRPGLLAWANHEYIEIMKADPETGQETLDTRFQGLGLVNDPGHPTGFRMTPNDRLVTMVSNTAHTPVERDPIFHDDPHFDQESFPGQLQEVDNPNENQLALTVTEEQMLQIKLAMLNTSIQINNDNPGFGMSGWGDPNSNSYRNTMGEVIKETAGLMGLDVSNEFDPAGASPGQGQRIPTNPVSLFEGNMTELRDAVKTAEGIHARQLDALRFDIDTDLNSTIHTKPMEASP